MISGKMISSILFLSLLMAHEKWVHAEDDLTQSVTVIGRVPVPSTGITRDMYHRVDRLIPALTKIPPQQVIVLECLYDGRKNKENDVLQAFTTAAYIEKYLREHHKLQVELWLSAHPKAGGDASALTFSVLSQSYRELDRLPADPLPADPALTAN